MAPYYMVNTGATSVVFAFLIVVVLTGENDLKTLRVDANFLENGEK